MARVVNVVFVLFSAFLSRLDWKSTCITILEPNWLSKNRQNFWNIHKKPLKNLASQIYLCVIMQFKNPFTIIHQPQPLCLKAQKLIFNILLIRINSFAIRF